MLQVIKTSVITFVISTALLLVSSYAIAEYSQTQNKIDDKESGQQSQPNHSSKNKSDEDKRQSSSETRDRNPEASKMDKRTQPEANVKEKNY